MAELRGLAFNPAPLLPKPLTQWTEAPTLRVEAGGEHLAYRELGVADDLPVLMLAHLGETLDEWDPRVIDALAQSHHIIAVDLSGIGASTTTMNAPPVNPGGAFIVVVEA